MLFFELRVIQKRLEKYVTKFQAQQASTSKKLLFWEQLISFEGFCQLSELFGSQGPWFGPGASGILIPCLATITNDYYDY